MIFKKIKFFFQRLRLRKFWKKVRKQDFYSSVTFAKFREENPISLSSFKDEVLNDFKK